jgi:hypothetical protein
MNPGNQHPTTLTTNDLAPFSPSALEVALRTETGTAFAPSFAALTTPPQKYALTYATNPVAFWDGASRAILDRVGVEAALESPLLDYCLDTRDETPLLLLALLLGRSCKHKVRCRWATYETGGVMHPCWRSS